MSKDYTDEEWTRRKNLQPPEGRWVVLPVVKQGEGRNAMKALRKKWGAGWTGFRNALK